MSVYQFMANQVDKNTITPPPRVLHEPIKDNRGPRWLLWSRRTERKAKWREKSGVYLVCLANMNVVTSLPEQIVEHIAVAERSDVHQHLGALPLLRRGADQCMSVKILH